MSGPAGGGAGRTVPGSCGASAGVLLRRQRPQLAVCAGQHRVFNTHLSRQCFCWTDSAAWVLLDTRNVRPGCMSTWKQILVFCSNCGAKLKRQTNILPRESLQICVFHFVFWFPERVYPKDDALFGALPAFLVYWGEQGTFLQTQWCETPVQIMSAAVDSFKTTFVRTV